MNTSVTDSENSLRKAQALHKEGKLAEAMEAYRKLSGMQEHREAAHQGIFSLSMQTNQIQQAVDSLVALIGIRPDSMTYHSHLAEIMQGIGHPEFAIAYFERMLQRFPEKADAHFSIGVLYKRVFRYQDARRAYEKAVELNARGLEEVHSNLGVLYSDMRNAEKARECYEKALEIKGDYQPALLNLAGLHEECGEREEAIEVYERALAHDPGCWDALSRVAQCSKPENEADPVIQRVREALNRDDVQGLARETLSFALGRLLDSTGQYEDAFAAYSEGNSLSRSRSGPYDRSRTEQGFAQLIEVFSDDWLTRSATRSAERPIFVCGMYRSGSTLTEQMLGQHGEVVSGGELDFLPWLISRNLGPDPEKAGQVTASELQRIGDAYVSMCKDLFPEAVNLTDKRPDNFLHLGLIMAMFPQARIVYTRRNPRDNCLSILFQPLGRNLSYASDFDDAMHYYEQHERLMEHWAGLIGDRICTVDYDELVVDPEPVLQRVVSFLGLDWDEACLKFERSSGPVKTASLWQVREGVHQSSSGRWKNYQAFIPALQ